MEGLPLMTGVLGIIAVLGVVLLFIRLKHGRPTLRSGEPLAYLDDLFRTAKQAVLICRPDGKIVFISSNIQKILFVPLSKDAYLPHSFPLSQRNLEQALNHCLTEKQSWRGEISLSHKGKSQHISICLSPVMEQGKVIQLMAILEDSSGRHKLREFTETIRYEQELILKHSLVSLVLEMDGKIRRTNDLFGHLFAIPENKLDLAIDDLFPKDSEGKALLKAARQHLAQGKPFVSEGYLVRANGSRFWARIYAKSSDSHAAERASASEQMAIADDGKREPVVWLFRDATQQKQLAEQQKQSSVVFDASADSILILDKNCAIRLVNPAFTQMTGYTKDEIFGKNLLLLMSARQPRDLFDDIWKALERESRWQGELWCRKRNGEDFPQWVTLTTVRNQHNEVHEYVFIGKDMTERKAHEEKILYQANYDELTNLPNRNYCMKRLQQSIERAQREGTQVALLFVDLDHFKNINDSLGHAAGDEVLLRVAQLLKRPVRESDLVGRFAGDEFVVVLSPVFGAQNAERVAEKIIQSLSQTMTVSGYEIQVRASIGISMFPNDASSASDLVKNADAAKNRAKTLGRNLYHFYTQAMQEAALARLQLERDLRYAVERKELFCHYQPQLDLATNRVKGMEVLVRWKSETRGMVPPVDFIPIAEENGLIWDIGELVLREACQQQKKWMQEGIAPDYIAVNVSTRQFSSPIFLELVNRVLKETDLPAEALELEVTESVLMDNHDQVISSMEELRQKGCKLSIDDFGTGYSSMSYLRQLPLTNLKIDQSFVRGTPEHTDNLAIVKAIINMAHALRLEVVAEGVEEATQLQFLKEHNCDIVQGYFFSRPLDVNACTRFLSNRRNELIAGESVKD